MADALPTPRLTDDRATICSLAGAGAVSYVLAVYEIWVRTDFPFWLVVCAPLAYSLALVLWARLRRPGAVAWVLAASLAGMGLGYILAVVVSNLASTAPDV